MEDTERTISNEQIKTKPFKIIKFGVDNIVKISIPHHLKALDNHCLNIEKYQLEGNWALVQEEQVNASNVVRSLKSNIRELEELNLLVKDEEREEFFDMIQSPVRDATEKLAAFLNLHSVAMNPIPELVTNDLPLNENVPKLICDSRKVSNGEVESYETNVAQLQVHAEISPELNHWGKLKNDFAELNQLFKSFAIAVLAQKESINTIEDNVQQATDNTIRGTQHLRTALILKRALFPVTGAVVGLMLGPVGAVAVGLHSFGTAVCAIGGSVLGYTVGNKIKNSQLPSNEIEMHAIEYTSSSKSDLHTPHDIASTSTIDTKKNV